MENKVAIIGGSGFIGSNLANYYFNKNFEVLLIGRNFDETRYVSKSIKTIELDVNFTNNLIENVESYTNIIWLINNLVPSTKMDNFVDDFVFNISPLVKFLEKIKLSPIIKKFVFLSSGGTVYGENLTRNAFTENDIKSPISEYGLNKLISENIIEFITKKSEFQSYILRPSNVFGLYQNLKKPQGIIGFAFNAVLMKTELEIYNNGNTVRDFIYIDDLCDAIYCCTQEKNKLTKTNIFNVGSSKGYSIKTVLEYIEEISNSELIIINKPKRIFDTGYMVLSSTKIYQELGWRPKIDLKEGLINIWKSNTKKHARKN